MAHPAHSFASSRWIQTQQSSTRATFGLCNSSRACTETRAHLSLQSSPNDLSARIKPLSSISLGTTETLCCDIKAANMLTRQAAPVTSAAASGSTQTGMSFLPAQPRSARVAPVDNSFGQSVPNKPYEARGLETPTSPPPMYQTPTQPGFAQQLPPAQDGAAIAQDAAAYFAAANQAFSYAVAQAPRVYMSRLGTAAGRVSQAPHIDPEFEFFDFSSVPGTNVLFPHQTPQLLSPSPVKVKVEGPQVYAFDPVLDTNADELWRFFMTHVGPPQLHVIIQGTHTETRTRWVRRGNAMTTETRTVTVTDFDFCIDATQYVVQQWSRMICVPRDGQRPQTYKETIEEFVKSPNKLKEIHLVKQLLWNFDELAQAIIYSVRMTGYTTSVKVKFPMANSKISVFCSDTMSQLAHNTCVRVLCVMTCLCIIFAPIYFASRKKVSNKIVCEYPMLISAPEFYTRNYYLIQQLALTRQKGSNPIPSRLSKQKAANMLTRQAAPVTSAAASGSTQTGMSFLPGQPRSARVAPVDNSFGQSVPNKPYEARGPETPTSPPPMYQTPTQPGFAQQLPPAQDGAAIAQDAAAYFAAANQAFSYAVAQAPRVYMPKLPHDFVDLRQKPEAKILLPKDCPQFSSPSDIPVQDSDFGFFAHSKVLDRSSDELWRFLMTYIGNPGLLINIRGVIINGNPKHVIEDGDIEGMDSDWTATDEFNFSIDASAYVAPMWGCIACVPRAGRKPKTCQQTIDEYTQSENIFKEYAGVELHIMKQVVWNFHALTLAIHSCIRQTGYAGTIVIRFKYAVNKISKRVSNTIVCEYPMAISEADFFMRNCALIQHHVKIRDCSTSCVRAI
nr:hypothetical protein HK105_000600 [Polyrhizophydium stewartii]